MAAAPAFAALETPTTEAASAITSSSATLNGLVNPKVSGTAGYHFGYSKNGNCEEAATQEEAEATGKEIKATAPLSELEGNTEYTFCVVATHAGETATGAALSFTTLKAKPTVTDGEATNVTPFAALIVNAVVNPENEKTSCVVEYGETLPSGKSVKCEPPTVEGTEPQGVSAAITGLESGKTYHYRVVAKNGTGEEKAEGEFTTLVAERPSLEGVQTSNLNSTSITIAAQINPDYQQTSYKLEYATNNAFTGATTVVGARSPLPAEFNFIPVSFTLSGLRPRTIYYYRLVAENGTGESKAEGEFTTRATPIVTEGAAQNVTQTMAEAAGTVNPGGLRTIAYIAFISQEGYEAAGGAAAANPYAGGRSTPIVTIEKSTNEVENYEAHGIGTPQMRELTPGTTYHYAVVATNAEGTTFGPDMTFTTAPATPPLAVTGGPVSVTQTSATLTGTIDTQGLQTTMSFEFGNTPALGSTESAAIVPGSESGTTVVISSSFGPYLQPGTTYYFRAVASNADGVSYGAVLSFTTGTFPGPVLTSPPPLTPTPVSPTKTTQPKKALTNAQKLAKALKACAKKPKSKRAACKRQAHKKYPKKTKKKKKK
ncbi:MAG TPA: hypothetical protein VK756_01910 [Solirubrobacteraceae bacterium]|nr:hypothetical protein [Solirubrobacteraceae bacterium]